MKRRAFTAFAILVILASSPSAFGRVNPERKSLRGLTAFSVLVESLSPELEKLGLTADRLQTDTEVRLRKAGLPVHEEAFDAYIYVNVNALIHSDGTASVSFRVSLEQSVVLERDSKITTIATTWDAGGVGGYGLRRLNEGARGFVADLVDKFINDYLAENPR